MGLDGELDGDVTSLEATLDRATASYALAMRHELAARREGQGSYGELDRTAALALIKTPTFVVGQLRWKGIDVSDDFLRYAARVARGEQLTPYRGQVLARASVDFPWSTTLRGSVDGPTQPTEPRARRRRRSRWLLGWARGAGALMMCMLLVGVGAAAMSGGQPAERPSWPLHPVAPQGVAAERPVGGNGRGDVPAASAETRSETAAKRTAPERKARTKARTRVAAWRRPRLPVAAPVSTAPAQAAPTGSGAVALQEPAATATAAPQPPVMTIVGSTTLPPLAEAGSVSTESALLIETPSF